MKINKIFAAALSATILLASCAKDNEGGKNAADGEATFAGVNISIPASTNTRADDSSAGIDGEKAIVEIGVFIVDTNNARLDYKFIEVNSANFTESTSGDNKKILTGTAASVIPTVTGNKKVFVVANPNGTLKAKLGSSGSTAMNAMAFGSPETDFRTITGSTLNNMVMTGAYTGTGGVLDMTTVKTVAQAEAAPVEVTIGRNLSKIVLQEASTYSVTGGTTTLTWTIVNKAKDAHFIKQPATLYSTVPTAAVTDDTHAYWSNFASETTYIPVVAKGSGDAKTASYTQSKYIFENLPADFLNGNTTAALVKGEFVPTVIYKGVTSGAPAVENSFSTGTTFLRSNIDGTYWTETGAAAAVAAVYNGHDSVTDDFTKYTDGVGYYTIHVNDGNGNKGVLRNGYYLMQINEVRGPGSPAPITDPNIPVEDDTNIVAKVEVLNWDFMKSIQDIQ